MPSPACRRLTRFLFVTAPCALLLPAIAGAGAAGQGRRVVDLVRAGDAASERAHDYEGDGATAGAAGGRPFRQTAGWIRYALKVWDDSEVTVACTFRGTDGRDASFELVVEGRVVVTHTLGSPTADPVTREFRVPEALTLGKTMITVVLRAVDGPTPGLIELRTVQEHLE